MARRHATTPGGRKWIAHYREWLLTAAQRAADAAKEGGFLGFRAERVSEGERRMLDKLREVLATPAG